jgi:hypothetical protein
VRLASNLTVSKEKRLIKTQIGAPGPAVAALATVRHGQRGNLVANCETADRWPDRLNDAREIRANANGVGFEVLPALVFLSAEVRSIGRITHHPDNNLVGGRGRHVGFNDAQVRRAVK